MPERMKPELPLTDHGWRWIFLAAALGFALAAPRFYVGYFSDDARDILAAQSIVAGGYRDLQSPQHPSANFPLPGFPLLLAPFVAFLLHRPEWLRVVPWGLTLGCIPLLNALAAPWTSRRERWIILALFAFNPSTVVAAGRVMADACFLATLLSFFVLLQSKAGESSRRVAVLLGLLAGYAAVVRPEGILLVPAACLMFWQANTRRMLVIFIFTALAPCGLFWLRNSWILGGATGYSSIWQDALPLLSGRYEAIFFNSAALLRAFSWDLLAGIDTNTWTGAWMILAAMAALAPVAAAAVGLGQMLSQPTRRSFAVLALGSFAVFYGLLHSAWLAIDPHYVWPLLPFLLLLACRGVQSWRARQRGARFTLYLLVVALMGSYAWQYALALQSIRQPPVNILFPTQTLAWVRASTPPQAYFLAPNAPLVTLYTGRPAMALINARDSDEFRYGLLNRGITHVVSTPWDFLYVQTTEGRDPARARGHGLLPGWAQNPLDIAPYS